jgi:putative ABC transport system permease protein
MGTLLNDVRFALRTLARRPGFALVAILTLAVGIGANSAVYSIAEAVLLRPLPFREPERLVFVWEQNVIRDRARNVVNPGNYLEWRDRSTVFEDIAAFFPHYDLSLTGDGDPVRLDAAVVTANFFTILGVSPALGRGFSEEDAKPGARNVVLLSHGLWKRRFGGDATVIGRDLTMSGGPSTILGVMPPSFQVPPGAEVWVPFTIGGGALRRDSRGRFLTTVARLKPGVSLEQAQGAMEGIAAQLVSERPDVDTGWSVLVAPLRSDLVREARPAILALFGAVALVLLIGCGNLANLLLVRSLFRGREIAIRRALGASRLRLVRQLLTESLVLALLGGMLGLLLAAWVTRGLLAVVPAEVQALFAVRLNPGVAFFALGLSVASAFIFGLAPAWQTVRAEPMGLLHEGSAGSGFSRGRRRLTRLVVATEIALSLVLLVGAGLLLRSFWRLSSVDAGFDPRRVLSLQVNPSGPRYREDGPQVQFYNDVLARIAAVPGVESVAGTTWRPLAIGMATTFEVPDHPAPPVGQEPVADVRMITPGLFRTLGIRLIEGRDFDARDAAGRPLVVIVNEAVARQFWPGQSALGRRIRMESGKMQEAEIVGVVGDVRLVGLETAPRASLYWPVAQMSIGLMNVLVKTSGRPTALAAAVKAAIASVDPDLPVAEIQTLEGVVSGALQRPRFTFVLIGAFAATAALLAALGLFGVLSYSVTQRLPEMGVRLALGARPADLAAMVLREGARVAGVGAGVGFLAALAVSRFLEQLLYETNPRDPLALLGVTLLIALASVAAAVLPAWRASRVEPASALRTE